MRLVAIVLAALPSLAWASASPRTLTLAEAVDLAMRFEPVVAEAKIADARGKLGVLRAQLDRFSLRVDGQLQELWNKGNILGPTVFDCTAAGTTFQSDPATCQGLGGTSSPSAVQSPSGGQGLFNLSANLNVPLFSGFRVESNVKRAQRTHDSTLVNIRQARKDTALAVARAYWSVRRLSLVRDAQAESLERLRDAEQVTESRLKVGLAPQIDRNRAILRRLQQEATLEEYVGEVREATVQLAELLGLGGADLVLVDMPNLPNTIPATAEALLGEAFVDRPELATARLQRDIQHQIVRMAQSTYYPQLNAFALLQYGNNPYIVGASSRTASDAANPFTNLAGNLTLGMTVSINFFDTLNTFTAVKDAKYEGSRLLEEERRTVRAVDTEVRLAHAKVLRLGARRAPLSAAAEVARDNLSILKNRYKNGDALVIEFLDAQVDLVNAESQLADVTAQLQLGWLELEAALGQTVGVKHE